MYTVIPAHEGWRVVTSSKEKGIQYHPIAAWLCDQGEFIPVTMLGKLPEGAVTIGPGDGVRIDNGVLVRVPKMKPPV
jgi:hypothetical protein